MKKLTQERLDEVIRLHGLWLERSPEGVKANLCHKDLGGLDFRGANLERASLYKANLRGANLRGANLYKANLKWTVLKWTILEEANLYKASLVGANLGRASLIEANLERTDIKKAHLWSTIGDGDRIQTHKLGIYTLNIYDDRIQIGCKNQSFEEWMSFSDKEIDLMEEGYSLGWWKEYKDRVIELYEGYRSSLC